MHKDLVLNAHLRLFDQHDLSVLEEQFAEDFVEHSPLVTGDRAGLRNFVQECGDDLSYSLARILANEEFVLLHGRFAGIEETDFVGFDLYRVEDGKIAEHWDGLVEAANPNPSGRTQLDGPTEQHSDLKQDAVAFVEGFFDDFLINQNYDAVDKYTFDDEFAQHASDIADGARNMADFLKQLKADGTPLVYHKRHRAIGFGSFVLTQSEGEIDGQRHFFYELWRVEERNGQLGVTELWDSIGPLPSDEEMNHCHGAF